MQRSLDSEDKRKIHAEINQLVNQRFLLATAAVTVFAIVSAWSIPKDPFILQGRVGAFTCAVSILLTLILFVLFLLSHLLATVLRTYASYLRLAEESKWEQDCKEYRSAGYSAYTKAIATLFLVLGLMSSAFPFGFGFIYSLVFEPVTGLWLAGGVGLAYFIFVSGMGFLRWFDQERVIDQRWQGILAQIRASDAATKQEVVQPRA